MLNVYAWSYGSVGMAMLGSLIIWRILAKCIRQDIWKVMNAVGAVVALLIILRFTVIGRESSNEHCFMVMAEYSGEFYREIIMNIFLYFPLGLTLGELTGCHVIWLAFLLSLGIAGSLQQEQGLPRGQMCCVIRWEPVWAECS